MSEVKLDKRSKAYRDSKLAQKQDLILDQGQDVIVDHMPDMQYGQYIAPIDNLDIGDSNDPLVNMPEIVHIPKQQQPIKEPTNQHMSQVAEQDNKIVAPKLADIRGRISIKPYVSGEENMGLEKSGEVLFPGIRQEDRLGCVAKGEYKTYFTGLDENATEIQTLPESKKIAKITTIRQVVAWLENKVANNFKVKVNSCMKHYGTDEDKFWENVTTFNSAGPDKYDQKGNRVPTYWDGVVLELTNDEKVLDKSDPRDLVIYYAIQGRGLSMVAPSLSEAMRSLGAYKWYLDQPEETADIKTEQKILRNQAGGYLESMRINDENRLFLMSKMVAVQGSSMYRRGGPNYTPVKQMYNDQYEYIEGNKGDNPTIAVGKFLEYYNMPIDAITRRAVIKDATEYRLIEPRGDGRLYYRNEPLGKTIDDMVEYLTNPLNERVWCELRDKIEQEWSN